MVISKEEKRLLRELRQTPLKKEELRVRKLEDKLKRRNQEVRALRESALKPVAKVRKDYSGSVNVPKGRFQKIAYNQIMSESPTKDVEDELNRARIRLEVKKVPIKARSELQSFRQQVRRMPSQNTQQAPIQQFPSPRKQPNQYSPPNPNAPRQMFEASSKPSSFKNFFEPKTDVEVYGDEGLTLFDSQKKGGKANEKSTGSFFGF